MLHGTPQRAVPRVRRARAGRQHPQPVLQPGAQTLHAKARHPRRRHLQRQRNPVELPANFRHAGAILRRQAETPVRRLHPPHEQRHGAKTLQFRHFRHAGTARRNRQRVQPEHRLGCNAQRLLAGGEDFQRGAAVQQRRRQRRDRAQQVLAIIEHQQAGLRAKRAGDRLGRRRSRRQPQTQRAGHRALHQPGFTDRRQVDQPHPARKFVRQRMPKRHRQPGLADPARPGQRHQARRLQRPPQVRQFRLAADQPGKFRRQDLFHRPRRRRRRYRRLAGPENLAGKTIAPPRHGLDQPMLPPQRPPQRHHLHMQIIFLDDHARPDQIQQLIFAKNPARLRQQRGQQVERARPHRHRSVLRGQHAPPVREPERPERHVTVAAVFAFHRQTAPFRAER